MDDFGDFFQAPPVTSHAPMKPTEQGGASQHVDLNTKILSSFDLSGSSHKASLKFQQPAKYAAKRPQGTQFKQSSSSADWKNINFDLSEFVAPVTLSHNTPAPLSSSSCQIQQKQVISGDITQQRHHLNQYAEQTRVGFQFNASHPQTNSQHAGQYFHDFTGQSVTGGWRGNIPSGFGIGNNDSGNAMMVNWLPTVPLNPAGSAHHAFPPQQNPSNNFGSSYQAPGISGLLSVEELTQAKASKVQANLTPYWMTDPPVHNLPTTSNGNRIIPTNTAGASTIGSTAKTQKILPSWMTDPHQIPTLYKQVLKRTATTNSFAETSLLYPIFLSSELPKDVLGHIWTAANQSSPGKLTFTEVYTALALIALAQKGEMNLTVGYVLKLPTAPLPKLKMLQGSVSSVGPAAAGGGTYPNYKNNGVPVDQSTVGSISKPIDFQSYAVSDSVVQRQNWSGAGSDDFHDFQSFTSYDNTVNTTHDSANQPSCPERDVLNSPKSKFKVDTVSKDPPKKLLANIDFQKFNNESSSKALHIAVRKLNISVPTAGKTLMNPASKVDDDFDDFKSAESMPQTQNEISIKMNLSSMLSPNQPSAVSLENDKYSALRIMEPTTHEVLGLDAKNHTQANNSDKYSSLCAVGISSSNEHSYVDDFADFQSIAYGQDNPSEPSQKSTNNTNTPPLFDKNIMSASEDIKSVSSLELPSLSRTILNSSIGTTVPSKSLEDVFSSPNDNNVETLFSTSAIKTMESTVRGSIFKTDVSSSNKPDNDEGLYDLDGPVSPLSQRKPVISSHMISRPTQKPVVLRPKISDVSDDDFGDFSSCPPPMEDDMDTEFELEEGDSSLVDFDAFGNFEEAKMEIHKQKEAAFKRTREDATAFSEFVKTSVVDLKPAHLDESRTSTSNQRVVNSVEEDSSVSENDCAPIHDVDDTLRVAVSTAIESSNDDVATSWKLEPTYSDFELENISKAGESKWEEEGNEIKARMQGASNPMEIFVDHWSRCLVTCKDIIVSTGDIFASLDSPSVCHEVVNSGRGKEFISCTSEVYGVARRIRKGMEAIGLEDNDLALSLKEIEIAWNNLLGFCPYTPSVHKTPQHKMYAKVDKSSSGCSLCLLDTASTEVTGLEYCGRFYHAPCANLWLNQIAPILPRLDLTISS